MNSFRYHVILGVPEIYIVAKRVLNFGIGTYLVVFGIGTYTDSVYTTGLGYPIKNMFQNNLSQTCFILTSLKSCFPQNKYEVPTIIQNDYTITK